MRGWSSQQSTCIYSVYRRRYHTARPYLALRFTYTHERQRLCVVSRAGSPHLPYARYRMRFIAARSMTTPCSGRKNTGRQEQGSTTTAVASNPRARDEGRTAMASPFALWGCLHLGPARRSVMAIGGQAYLWSSGLHCPLHKTSVLRTESDSSCASRIWN